MVPHISSVIDEKRLYIAVSGHFSHTSGHYKTSARTQPLTHMLPAMPNIFDRHEIDSLMCMYVRGARLQLKTPNYTSTCTANHAMVTVMVIMMARVGYGSVGR